jgi:hypothetical protein
MRFRLNLLMLVLVGMGNEQDMAHLPGLLEPAE